ncbi:S41 family peptidase [Agathobaculum sp.]|uniref:S41 family peptidase n=1 Tax=Agathobaculum sp. TaxID=2048138 RepID=UPI002A840C56|nr:S41 family peptidase [Agathobaculum sp.]MDY3618570.1 S41 family peptidase [Agathobaculum sp.]
MRDKKISLATALVLCLMAAAAGIACCYALFGWHTQAVQEKLREIDALVAEKYVGEVDVKQVADYAAIGYLTGLDDKWSSYIPADQYAAYQLRNDGQGVGIGVSVMTTKDSIHVYEVYDDSPAQQAGIEKGDYILAAEDKTIEKDGGEAVVEAVQGEAGTEVTLTVRKGEAGESKTLTMIRAVVTQKMAWGEMLDGKVGYLRITNFRNGSADQFDAALDTLLEDGAKSLIVDVRHNGGGKVKQMSQMLDRLLPEGTIMTLRTKTGAETVYESDADMTDLPVAVLIDESSISAAEFFAAALQEYGRATLVGTHTTGKGRAQQTFALSDGSALNLSTEEYFTPKGNNLADKGIAPDIEVKLSDEQRANFYFLTPEIDPQLAKAVEILS